MSCDMAPLLTSRLPALASQGLFRFFDVSEIWEFPKIRGTILGVPIIRIVVFMNVKRGRRDSASGANENEISGASTTPQDTYEISTSRKAQQVKTFGAVVCL